MEKEIIKSNLIDEIVKKILILVFDEGFVDEDEREIWEIEYRNQLENFEHNENIRVYIGYMIEIGSKKAIEIMKLIIRYNLMMSKNCGS